LDELLDKLLTDSFIKRYTTFETAQNFIDAYDKSPDARLHSVVIGVKCNCSRGKILHFENLETKTKKNYIVNTLS